MRSGTDQYHGGLFPQFYRSNDFNANDFFFNAVGKPAPRALAEPIRRHRGGSSSQTQAHVLVLLLSGNGAEEWRIQCCYRYTSSVAELVPVGESETTYATALSGAFGVPLASIDPVAVNVLLQPGQYGGFLVGSATGTRGTLANYAISLPTIYNENQYSASIDHDLFLTTTMSRCSSSTRILPNTPRRGAVSV